MLNQTPRTDHGTPLVDAVPPAPSGQPRRALRLSSHDRVIERSVCWRHDCRAVNGVYPTIAVCDRVVVAFCHRRVHDELSYRADRWKYGAVAA